MERANVTIGSQLVESPRRPRRSGFDSLSPAAWEAGKLQSERQERIGKKCPVCLVFEEGTHCDPLMGPRDPILFFPRVVSPLAEGIPEVRFSELMRGKPFQTMGSSDGN